MTDTELQMPKRDAMNEYRDSVLSKASKKFDIGNKGFLTEAERAARNLDHGDEGQVTNEMVIKMMEQTMNLQESHTSLMQSLSTMKKVTIALFVLILLLAISNLFTSWAAVQLSKDMSVGTDGSLISKVDGSVIHTMGTGQVLELPLQGEDPITGRPYSCIPVEHASSVYKNTKEGVTTSAVWSVANGKNAETTRELGMALSFEGATFNETHACLKTQDGKSMVCYLFHSDLCVGVEEGNNDHNDRRLKEVHPEDVKHRRELFRMLADGATPEEVEEHKQDHRRLCAPCLSSPQCGACGGRRLQGGSGSSNVACNLKDCFRDPNNNCYKGCNTVGSFTFEICAHPGELGALAFGTECIELDPSIPNECGPVCEHFHLEQWCHDNVCVADYHGMFGPGQTPGFFEEGVCQDWNEAPAFGWTTWNDPHVPANIASYFQAAGFDPTQFCEQYCCCWHERCNELNPFSNTDWSTLPCTCVFGCEDIYVDQQGNEVP